MRMSRAARVSRVRADMIGPALVVHTHGRSRASHSRSNRETDPRGMPHLWRCSEATQTGRLRAHEVVTAGTVGNVAAVGHEIGVSREAAAVSVATASIAGAATSETAAREMATTAMKPAAATV